ncbi:SDR family oxidoreductase [Chitinophaga pendula]|uniref:SDR family oxidoreductase n=1 Tax=Chitinophaga TaxID=79328 RepID=UPI000BAE92BC|nr:MULTISPECIES: SDR family oxidoreductase [Chitinophaga]ASZ13302.1 3-beta hydroxysteroid dehydrogenase [Chitinophaga sp. MD30]UCJ09074.1 SDR family oxidoreductase [Chitinophaga pendula]
MQVFVTGASGFVGSAIVKELLQAGHQVLGLARTDNAAEKLLAAGANVHRGNLDDLRTIKEGAADCDAVIHTAFNHDFSRFKASCEEDRQVIETLGEALTGTDRPLVITSGVGLLNYGRLVTEKDQPASSDTIPRAATEEAANALAAKGVNTYIVRLPPTVHGPGDHGFISMIINIAREKGQAAYIGEGLNRWPAVHRYDAANLYRLIIEKQPTQRVFHAVAEEGIPFRQIATSIGEALQVPVTGLDTQAATAFFEWFTHFAAIDCPASSEQTRQTLGWIPQHPELSAELVPGIYF